MKLNDFSIGMRLHTGFLVILALTGIIVVVDQNDLRSQRLLLTRIIGEDSQKLAIISEMREIVFREAIDLRDGIILSDRPSIREKISIIGRGKRAFKDAKAKLGKYYSSDDEPQLYEDIIATYLSIEPVTNRVTDLALENRDQEALTVLVKEWLPIQKRLLDLLNQLVGHIRERQVNDLRMEAALYSTRRSAELGIGIGVILISGVIAWCITRSITVPLARLTAASRRLLRGEPSTELPINLKDEIGALSRTLHNAFVELHREQRLEQLLRSEILAKEKLAEVGQFASGIVHNLRNPLTVVTASAKLLQRNVGSHSEHVESILAASAEMERTITNILNKVRHEHSTTIKALDLNRIIEDGLGFLEASSFFKHKVTKVLELCDDLPLINGVHSDLSQSLSNIIKNAVDAMVESPQKLLTIRTWHTNTHICVRISDTGVGMDKEGLAHLFEPFYSTKSFGDEAPAQSLVGTGLGLFMVKALLGKYAAEFDVTSQPGAGTSFTVKIPKHSS